MSHFIGIINLPSYLVEVPMTKGINNIVYACEFDSGPIHSYGFKMDPDWLENEPDTEPIYS